MHAPGFSILHLVALTTNHVCGMSSEDLLFFIIFVIDVVPMMMLVREDGRIKTHYACPCEE